MYKIGIDVGGTFTDLVVEREGEPPRTFKTPSTPQDPSDGLLVGLEDVAAAFGVSLKDLLAQTERIIHGTTIATNTLVERKGARVGLITTEGFRDLLEMREGLKEDRYNLRMTPVEPLVPRYLRLGIPERVRSDGAVEVPLDEEALDRALDALEREGVDALAVCFLFSYLNPDHERRVAEKVRDRFPGAYTSLSHEVLPQIREFDRLSTTVVNSYVGPAVGEYLTRLKERLASTAHDQDLLVLQSNGGVAPIEDTVRLAVRSILSGPAGGVSGAAYYGGLLDESKVIGLDMGGTSADISLISDGVPEVTTEKFEGGWKIAVPMIDIQTLGAGGGSIAGVDAGGILHVGPGSAGAEPGPASYGKGGTDPTVTDASAVLGYLDPANFLGGKAPLDRALAEQAVERDVATPLGLSTVEAAQGIHEVVATNMAEGIRLIVGNQRKWDTLRPERLEIGRGLGELPEGLVVAPSPFDCVSLHLLPALQYPFPPPVEHICRCHIAQRLVIAPVVVVGHEGGKGSLQIGSHLVGDLLDVSLDSLVIALQLAVGLRVEGCSPDVLDSHQAQVVSEATGHIS